MAPAEGTIAEEPEAEAAATVGEVIVALPCDLYISYSRHVHRPLDHLS